MVGARNKIFFKSKIAKNNERPPNEVAVSDLSWRNTKAFSLPAPVLPSCFS